MRISIEKAIAEAVHVDVHMRVHKNASFDDPPEVVILEASPGWLLARLLEGGHVPNGYLAISRGHVRHLETTKFHAFRKRMLEAEGIRPAGLRAPAIDLQSAASILRCLKRRGNLAMILCETYEEWHSIYCRIERVDERSATLLGFDGAGNWQHRPKRLDLDDITRIRFGSRYLQLFRKYLSKTSASQNAS